MDRLVALTTYRDKSGDEVLYAATRSGRVWWWEGGEWRQAAPVPYTEAWDVAALAEAVIHREGKEL